MEEKTKKLIFFIGSLFVAVIFVTSYAAFSNNGSNSSSTTTLSSANTVYVYGNANALIVNYSYTAYITTGNKTTFSRLNNTLGTLEANGTISNFVPLNGTTFEAILSTVNPYQLYAYLSNTPISLNVSVSTQAYVRLPLTVTMTYGNGQSIPVSFPPKNYTLFLPKTMPLNSTVPLKISALITTNGQVFNNNIRLTEG
jgi:hypothetical protein